MKHHVISGLDVWSWQHVMPGDTVVSQGSLAFFARDYLTRNEDTKVLKLALAPILCLARVPGTISPSTDKHWNDMEGHHDSLITFVVLSRHGVLVVVQHDVAKLRLQPYD